MKTRLLVAAVAGLLAFAALPGTAFAQGEDTLGSQPVPVTVPSELPQTPPDFAIPAGDAINIANRTDTAAQIRLDNDAVDAVPQVRPGRWEIYYNVGGQGVALVIVDGRTGDVVEEWTGDQVAWQMARGYEGQFGHILNAPWVWIPLAMIFFLGLFDFRRARRLAHLDLLVLLSFGVSHIFFNTADIGASVLLAYPPLIYLLCRMIWIGFRGTGEGLRPSAPIAVLLIAAIFLIGFRIAVNIVDSSVIDVGYAGTIGADRITNLEELYGPEAFPPDNRPGDTYGPANYYAYIPFELIFPWEGTWDDLPSARAAVIFFDLATIAGLFFLGRRLRQGRAGRDLGITLAFAWTAYPYTAFAMQSNTNDPLVSALLVWSLVFFSKLGVRATLLAFASLVKFTPLILVPLYAVGERGLSLRLKRSEMLGPRMLRVAYFSIVFFVVFALLMVYPAIEPGLSIAWDRTFATQLGRESPFSVWGQLEWTDPIKNVLLVVLGAFACYLAFKPERRTLLQVAALTAALMLGAEIVLEHWFYLYIPWFLAPLLAAIALGPSRQNVDPLATVGAPPARPPQVGLRREATRRVRKRKAKPPAGSAKPARGSGGTTRREGGSGSPPPDPP